MQVDIMTAKTLTDTERDSIKNSIGTMASTPYGTAPFMRSMGIKDYPPKNGSNVERNNYATEVITQAGIWENRAKVSEVSFVGEHDVKVVITSNG